MRRLLGHTLLLLLVGVLFAGCGLIGVGLSLTIELDDDHPGLSLEGSTLTVDIAQIDVEDPPDLEAKVRFRTTGTVGRLQVNELIVQYVEIEDNQPLGEWEEVYRQDLDVDTPAIGGISDTESLAYALPESLLDELRDDAESLVGRTFRMEILVTGSQQARATFDFAFVNSLD